MINFAICTLTKYCLGGENIENGKGKLDNAYYILH
jgi:hypothetical protein